MELKKVLKGNVVAIGKNYKELSCEEIKLLLKLKCISNKNNYIVATNKNALISLSELDKRTFDKHFNSLIERSIISIEGDISKCCNIEIKKDENFETFDVEFILDMLNDLTPAEIKLFCTMIVNLNFKKNKNYIFPSLNALVEGYYSKNELDGLDYNKIKNKTKNIDILKSKLIEKGYIVKIVSFRINENKSKLGYFLKTGKDEIIDYDTFIKKQSEKSKMKLSTKSSLEKQGYKNLDKYIYSDYEYDSTKENHTECENNTNIAKKSEDNAFCSKNEIKKFNELLESKNNDTLKYHKNWKECINKYGYEFLSKFLKYEYDEIIYKKLYKIKDQQLLANTFMKNIDIYINSYKKELEILKTQNEISTARGIAQLEEMNELGIDFDYFKTTKNLKNKKRSIEDILNNL